ncbi:MAG: GntR family transcriptional regulator [Terracidiphilus sp.]|jgi:GntR family transcriptional regulator
MRLWLNHTGEVSLREQLVTQVVLGILCQELAPGQRLPSTRELARRFSIHANTASAAYKQLEQEGWVEFRRGSGVYVRASLPAAPLAPELAVEFALDQMIGELIAKSRTLGAPETLLRERLRRWIQLTPPSRWLVIEPDPELRRILIYEMRQALKLPIDGCAPEECFAPGTIDGALPVTVPSKAAMVREVLSKLPPASADLTILQVHPVSAELLAHLQRYMPAQAGVLVGIASRWREFLRIAQTMLIAAGLPPESLLVRDASEPDWKRGLETASGVVCDAVTALELPRSSFPLRFTLLDEATLAGLRKLEERISVYAQ